VLPGFSGTCRRFAAHRYLPVTWGWRPRLFHAAALRLQWWHAQ
jgi:hypothetical protein